MPTSRKIRVLIVDDSASVRSTLSEIIAADPDLEVMATAADPYVAVERIRQEVPDVIFLDVEMPRMDGLTFLRKLMSQRPIPVVICSSLAEAGSDTLMQLMEAGAVDVVTKPRVDTAQFLHESSMRICDAAKAAAHAKLRGIKKAAPQLKVEAKLTADAVLPPLSTARAASLKLNMPAIVTTDLRLNEPRYASLPNIMKAKKKPLDKKSPADFGVSTEPRLKVLKTEEPSGRKAGVKVKSVAELVEKLKSEAGVL